MLRGVSGDEHCRVSFEWCPAKIIALHWALGENRRRRCAIDDAGRGDVERDVVDVVDVIDYVMIDQGRAQIDADAGSLYRWLDMDDLYRRILSRDDDAGAA